ncbi:hypothetical protein LOY64_03770 [Pseudomonas corrugata]|uniref:hypothetical protein n=1 Tax=Pseudomonas corrugata TaxID=47879 RepID=UPI0006D8D05D|nr:hypothetical protein [Pseudomonas corrugata]AOE63725.1 hypothetical protein AXG94_18820 [Pseudomonas corrugata]MDU9026256.1 hypothetical protein [Pseudomonas corrugata]UZD96139.1 hypothetical protein LOY64_03770 [Pseudomonas corrugata]
MRKNIFIVLAVALAGCHSNVRDSSPSLFKNGVQLQQTKVVADAEHAKVIMKSTGFPHPVQFSVRRSSDTDQRAEVLGTVVDSGRGKVFGWIAKMNEVTNSAAVKRFPQLEMQVDPGQTVEVIGESRVYDSNYYRYAERVVYECGPMNSTFKPEKQKVYLVEFVIIEAGCEQHVYDVTQPQERIPVASASGL